MKFNPIMPALALQNRHKHIKDQARKNKEVVYGARAMNKQLPYGFLKKHTFDWDIFSRGPKKSARQLERKMDKESGGNHYYTKAAKHPGTYKVIHVGFDGKKGTTDDVSIVDYTKHPGRVKTVTLQGVKYRHISIEKQRRKAILKDPEFKFRHERDKQDLNRMRVSNQLSKVFRMRNVFGGKF